MHKEADYALSHNEVTKKANPVTFRLTFWKIGNQMNLDQTEEIITSLNHF